jgi:hypothetical protein
VRKAPGPAEILEYFRAIQKISSRIHCLFPTLARPIVHGGEPRVTHIEQRFHIMQTNFILDNFRITDTRSRHKDTVWVSLSIAVGSNDAITEVTRIGDRDNGTFPVRRHVSADIPEDVDVPVAFSYLLVNNGNAESSKLEDGLKNAVATLGSEAAKAATTAAGETVGEIIGASLGTAVVPLVGTAIGVVAGWVVGKVGAILFANCDGTVAAGIHVITSKQIIQAAVAGREITETVEHPGTSSPSGCGGNSKYFTTTVINTGNVV